MVRLAVRKKTPSRSARYSVKRTIPKRTAATKKTAVKRKVAKRKAAKKAVIVPIFVPRIKTLMNNLNTFTIRRKKLFGPSDPVAKRLQTIHTAIGKELRKANVINLNMAKCLKNITPSIRGVSNVPPAIRMNAPKLAKFIRECVRKDVIKFITMMKTTLSPMQTELKKLEMQLNKHVKLAKSKKLQLKVDHALKRRFNTLNNNITKFRTKWFKRLNGLNLHGNRNVQIAVNQLKKQVDELHKTVRKNLTILNRYGKAAKLKKGFKMQQILTAAQTKAFESKYNRINTDLEKFRMHVERYFDQLKAVKLF